MRLLLLFCVCLVLVGCASKQSYECNADKELCELYIEQAENRDIILRLSTIVEECKKLGLTDYEMRLTSKKDRGQCVLSENELNIRKKHNDELWTKITVQK